MQIADLTFEDGRAAVPLADKTVLSILNEDRNAVLLEERSWAPPGVYFPLTRACDEDGTYEVALATADQSRCAGPIPEWESYGDAADDAEVGGTWITYRYVPAAVIENYIARVGTL